MNTSGWLDGIPRHWTLAPLYARYEVQLGKMLDASRFTGLHARPYLRNVDVQWDVIKTIDLPTMDFDAHDRVKYSLRSGDLLVCEGGEIGRTAMWHGELEECYFQKAVHRLRPRTTADWPRYLYYAMRAGATYGLFAADANPNTISHLTAEKLRRHRFPFPPYEEQREIADFLDRETRVIDDLISAKHTLIRLAQEKRQSYVSEVCIAGLNNRVQKKDSGIPTLGEIPEHWEVVRNKTLFREIDERSVDGAEELLTVSHITGVTRRSEKPEVTMFMAESLEGYKKCNRDDLIINTMWAWMGALGISAYDGIVSPGYNVYRLKARALPAFLDLLYRTPQYIAEFTRWSKGVWESRLRLYPFEFLQILTPLPPLDEQQQIVAAIEDKMGGIRASIETLEKSISILTEYHSTLISAAVTGQIDVRSHRSQEAAVVCP